MLLRMKKRELALPTPGVLTIPRVVCSPRRCRAFAFAAAAALLAACAGSSPSAATPSPAPTPAPTSGPGLFTDPRPSPPGELRALGPLPHTFPDWDRTSTMLYDTQSGTATDLGPGSLGHFSPDSTRMVWVASPQAPFGAGEVWMINLHTLEKRDLGPGRLAVFTDDTHVSIAQKNGNDSETVDLTTGARTPVGGLPAFQPALKVLTPDGLTLERHEGSTPGTDVYTLNDPISGAHLLEFAAYAAVPAGPRHLAVMTPPRPSGPPDDRGFAPSTTNVFLVDIDHLSNTTFLATSPARFPVWALAADNRYVIWSHEYCDGGHGRIYDRETKKLVQVDLPLWPAKIVNGSLLEGVFGGDAVIDLATLKYRAAISGGGDRAWSPDLRYASLGQTGGHGGVCG
jgi:hypothetical protein